MNSKVKDYIDKKSIKIVSNINLDKKEISYSNDWIFADFTMRMRLENYNPLFAYYYFRTNYFQYLIEINKKWLWNNTNIFPSQIQEFPLIDIPLPDQQKIVDEIKLELDKQELIKKDIEKERNKIDELIEKSLKN